MYTQMTPWSSHIKIMVYFIWCIRGQEKSGSKAYRAVPQTDSGG